MENEIQAIQFTLSKETLGDKLINHDETERQRPLRLSADISTNTFWKKFIA